MQTTLGNEEVPTYSPNKGDQALADRTIVFSG